MVDLDEAIESILECAQQGIYYPQQWKGRLSMDDAYRVQLGILRKLTGEGALHAGWKVGLTAKAMQEQQRVHEPVFGFFLESNHRPSGTVFDFDGLIQPAFENELCLTVGEPLRGPDVTLEQARAAIVAVAPALELPERRGDFAADLPQTVADNSQAKYFVTGAETSPLPADLDLSRTTVEVVVNGEAVEQAEGTAVMGNPVLSVVWLANKLHQFGWRIEAGQRIMSGSFTKQYALGRGDHIEARFDPFGPVEAEFQ